MSLLQDAYRTYDNYTHLVGVEVEGQTPLAPISHSVQNAQIEITLKWDGTFVTASVVQKEDERTVISVTENSASRSGTKPVPHPLCEQIKYLIPDNAEKYIGYCEQLQQWVDSAYVHPIPQSVLTYMKANTLISDLAQAAILKLDSLGVPEKQKLQGKEWSDCLIRWRITPPPDDGEGACWKSKSLFHAYQSYYAELLRVQHHDICYISGEDGILCSKHPKGTVQSQFGAKLISANDSKGFTYRGRFSEAEEAYSVSYESSQKAHNMLRWLAANHGIRMGGRTFLCWNPAGKVVPPFIMGLQFDTAPADFISYREELKQTLQGYRLAFDDSDEVIVASLDAATTGRLSTTYYNVLQGSDFLHRIQNWYETCCVDTGLWGVQSPPLWQIVNCAYGVQRNKKLECDDRVFREQIQRLFHCIVDGQPIPSDWVHALCIRASTPLAYDENPRYQVQNIACAIIRKYHNDRYQKEVFTLALDNDNKDRSYLFGRLLAIAEMVERNTYDKDEKREPNAIRMQTMFAQRPVYGWRLLQEQLTPYFAKLYKGSRQYYRKLIGEILDSFEANDSTLNKKLDDTYILGYYHQRQALYRSTKDIQPTETESEA